MLGRVGREKFVGAVEVNDITRKWPIESANQGACMGLTYVLCLYVMVVCVPVGSLMVEAVSDSLPTFWDPFPTISLTHSVSI